MTRNKEESFIKVYRNPKHWNDVLAYMMENMSDAKYGQMVNFGKFEKHGIAKADEKLHQLLEDGTIKHISNDIYQINPFVIGNGEWDDVSDLQDKYKEVI